MAIAAVLKTAARKDVWVRIPGPPSPDTRAIVSFTITRHDTVGGLRQKASHDCFHASWPVISCAESPARSGADTLAPASQLLRPK